MIRVPAPRVGAGLAFRRDPLRFLQSRDRGNGPIEFQAGLTRFMVIKEPATIQRVLVADAELYREGKWTLRGERVMGDCLITRDGELHQGRRALLQPAFDPRRIATRARALVARAERLGRAWRDGEAIDVRAQMSRLGLTAAAEALFSLELEPDAAALVPALDTLLAEIPRPGLPWPAGRGLARARRRVERSVAEAVAARRANGAGADDVLSLLLAGELSDQQVVDEIVSLLIAAVDTTPGALAWTWRRLARHPEVEARVHEELDAVLDGRPPAAREVGRLEYLGRVLTEVLRLHPPVHFIDRRPAVDVELDGQRVPAGTFLLLSPLLTHRDPRFYDEPGRFHPERWTREARRQLPRYAYFPFGGGPHTCIGMGLARMELSLVVATLAREWRLVPPPSDPDGQSMVARRR